VGAPNLINLRVEERAGVTDIDTVDIGDAVFQELAENGLSRSEADATFRH
jgi:hypothetical protein